MARDGRKSKSTDGEKTNYSKIERGKSLEEEEIVRKASLLKYKEDLTSDKEKQGRTLG